MKANTRLFGEIEITEEKLIRFENGIIGFPDLRSFALIFDEEKGVENSIMWLQSMDEPAFAMPVVKPTDLLPEYSPSVKEELLLPLGDLTPDSTYLLVTVTVPKEIEQMSVNLKAPFVINYQTGKGSQIIVDDELEVKFKIYHLLKEAREKAGA
ncbi:MAG: flagellar assembly protein FliW [Lachnospiraceae bacterium]